MVLLSTMVAPTSVLAEARWCTWTNDSLLSAEGGGELACESDQDCELDEDCDGRRCVLVDATHRVCAPPCTTIRLAQEAADCELGTYRALSGSAPDVVDDESDYEPEGYCEFFGVTTCESAASEPPEDWEAWEAQYIRSESAARRAASHTNTWGFGPQAAGCGTPPFAPPSCPQPRDTGPCAIVGGMLTCSPTGSVCNATACNPGRTLWTSDCPALAGSVGSVGACAPTDGAENLPLGFCIYEEWFAGCAGEDSGSFLDCFTSPIDGSFGNFYDGDCDGDGCPNGFDSNPCLRCDGSECSTVSRDPRPLCRGLPPVDLRDPIDCAPDAGPPDAGGASDDAGITAMDTGPRPTFGGGGGCTCTASSGTSPSAGLLAVVLALALIQRRRRAAR